MFSYTSQYPLKSITDLEIEIEWHGKAMTMAKRKLFYYKWEDHKNGTNIHTRKIEMAQHSYDFHKKEYYSFIDEFNHRVNPPWKNQKKIYPNSHNMWEIPDAKEYRLQ